MNIKQTLAATAALAVVALPFAAHAGPKAEVLHWWTSGGESKAVKSLMEEFKSNGGTGPTCRSRAAAAMRR